mgnify:CR=1 FL=1
MKEIKLERQPFKFGITTVFLGIIMLIISIAFFYLLDKKTGAGFGLSEVLFSVAVTVLITGLMLFAKEVMVRDKYLGGIIGIVILAAGEYSLFFKFKGPYTTTFAIISAIVVLVYLGINFFGRK